MADIKKIYETDFDGHAYASAYLQDVDYEHKWVLEDFYHRLFKEGKLKGKTLIDVGCGPTMRSALSASGHVNEIYLADFVENNRILVNKWLQNTPDAFDFSTLFKYTAQLEGKTDIKYLEERVRKCVKQVLFCDILSDNPLCTPNLRQFDIVTSSFCLDVFPDYTDYKKGWKNIASLLKPDGYIVFAGTIESTHYFVGDKKLPTIALNRSSVETAITDAGLEIIEFEEYFCKDQLTVGTDYKGVFTALTKKKLK